MKKVPLNWLVVDELYKMVGQLGRWFRIVGLIDIELAHIKRRLKQCGSL